MRFNDTMRAGSQGGGGWLGQHTNAIRAVRRRQIKAAGGIRQYKKMLRQARLERTAVA